MTSLQPSSSLFLAHVYRPGLEYEKPQPVAPDPTERPRMGVVTTVINVSESELDWRYSRSVPIVGVACAKRRRTRLSLALS
jgi:hypothetical protein